MVTEFWLQRFTTRPLLGSSCCSSKHMTRFSKLHRCLWAPVASRFGFPRMPVGVPLERSVEGCVFLRSLTGGAIFGSCPRASCFFSGPSNIFNLGLRYYPCCKVMKMCSGPPTSTASILPSPRLRAQGRARGDVFCSPSQLPFTNCCGSVTLPCHLSTDTWSSRPVTGHCERHRKGSINYRR